MCLAGSPLAEGVLRSARPLLRGVGWAVTCPAALSGGGGGGLEREGSRCLCPRTPPAQATAARPCPPSLQLFDAHHEVEVALGVLLDDVPHVVGLPRLLQAEGMSHCPLCAPGSATADSVGAQGLWGFKEITRVVRQAGLARAHAVPGGHQGLGHPAPGCRELGCPGRLAVPSGPQLPAHSPAGACPLSLYRLPGPILRWPGKSWLS